MSNRISTYERENLKQQINRQLQLCVTLLAHGPIDIQGNTSLMEELFSAHRPEEMLALQAGLGSRHLYPGVFNTQDTGAGLWIAGGYSIHVTQWRHPLDYTALIGSSLPPKAGWYTIQPGYVYYKKILDWAAKFVIISAAVGDMRQRVTDFICPDGKFACTTPGQIVRVFPGIARVLPDKYRGILAEAKRTSRLPPRDGIQERLPTPAYMQGMLGLLAKGKLLETSDFGYPAYYWRAHKTRAAE